MNLAVFVWNDPELKRLKEKTENEPTWRRLMAIIMVFSIIVFFGSIGFVLGIVFVNLVQYGVINLSVVDLLQIKLEKYHIVVAAIFMAAFVPIGILAWMRLMKKTKFISMDTLERIRRFGLY